MPKHSAPRKGTLQFWPRKRAKRIYPRVKLPNNSEGVNAFAVYKAGMTHVSMTDSRKGSKTTGRVISRPVTVLDAPPLFVCGLRFYQNSLVLGEKWFSKLPKNLSRKILTKNLPTEFSKEGFDEVRLIVCTQPEKSGIHKKKPELLEIPYKNDNYEEMLGKEISIKDVFKPGQFLDVSGVTKGRGFTGPVKRFGIRIQSRKNEQHHRHVGSIGSWIPRRVDWRVPFAGQHGFHKRTEFNKRVVQVDDDVSKINPKGGFIGYGLIKDSYILVEGSVPGPRKRMLVLRKGVRPKPEMQVDLKYVSQESKQGR